MATRGLALMLVVLALGGLLAYSKYRPTQDRVSGFIEADEIRLGSRVGGRVLKVHIAEGQRVKPGDLLVELEPFSLLAELKRAESTLAAREADFQRLQTGLRTEEVAQALARYERLQAKLDELIAGPRKEEIEAARARLGVAEAQLKLGQETFRRATRLSESNASTQENLDQATEQLEAAQGSLAAQQEELKLLEAGTRDEVLRAAKAQTEEARLAWELAKQGFRAEEIAQAQAERDAAAAAVDAVKQSVAELEIRSPVGGVIEALELQPGDLAPAGSPTMSIMDDSHLWIRAYVPENRLDVRLGQKLSVTVDSFPDREFAGELTFISRQAEFTPSNVQTAEERVKQVFRIKVELRDGLDLLRAGMAADVWLTDQADDAAAPAAEPAAP
jgi:HlyD family secretion protein